MTGMGGYLAARCLWAWRGPGKSLGAWEETHGPGGDPGHERVLGAWEGTRGLVGGPGPKERSEGGMGGWLRWGLPHRPAARLPAPLGAADVWAGPPPDGAGFGACSAVRAFP